MVVFPSSVERDAFLPHFQQLDECRQKNTFSTLLHALSIECTSTERISMIPGKHTIYPVLQFKRPRVITRDVANMQLKFAHGVTGVQSIHSTLGLTGKGIKVGIIDTGMDYHHPALGGCFGKGCKIAYGYDFCGDDFSEDSPIPQPDDDPFDACVGHGTHVAGIVAAKDAQFTGVAPDVILGSYRAISCHDYTTSDVLIAAMERAYKDGMDIINMSLGVPNGWADYPSCRAVNALADKGVVVVAAMGNQGEAGYWMASSPAMAEKALAVASYDNVRYMAYGFTVGNANATFDYVMSNQQRRLEVEHAPLVHVTFTKDCVPDNPLNVVGKVVLISSHTCSTDVKVRQLKDAAAIVVYNAVFGEFTPNLQDKDVACPVVGVTQKTGWALLDLLNTTITSSKDQMVFDNPSGGRVSLFSSAGPGSELELKADIGAPGGLIYSTFPLKKGGYATLSGTSMASPYVAGSIALYMQAKGKQSPQHIIDVFKATAQPTTELNSLELTPVFKQGAGLIQVEDAILSTTTIEPTKLPLFSADAKTGKLKAITITNRGKYALRYTVTHRPALAVDPWDKFGELSTTPAYHNASMRVQIDTKQVTLQPGQSTKINLFFSPPSALEPSKRWLLSGYIVVTPHAAPKDVDKGFVVHTPSLSVPYGGLHGNYKGLPLIPREDSPIVYAPLGQESFSLKTEEDSPFVMTRFILPCKQFYLTLLDKDNRTLGRIPGSDMTQVGRGNYYSLKWEGTYVVNNATVKVPSGMYRVMATAIGPFDGTDVRYTPTITIDLDKIPEPEGDTLAAPTLPALSTTDDSVLPQRIHFPPQT